MRPRCGRRWPRDDGGILAFGGFFADAQRGALPVAAPIGSSGHVGFLKGAAAVLAAPDHGLMTRVEADRRPGRCPLPAADVDRS